jgi:superfamily II DNA or RNA helicase
LCLRILLPFLPFHPHDYQIKGVCAALDRKDILAILPTGSGKTGLFFMYLLAIRALKVDPSLCPRWVRNKKILEKPLIIAVCPTIYLEHQIVCGKYLLSSSILKALQNTVMSDYGLNGLVINSDTLQRSTSDLWKMAKEDEDISVILLAPEQLEKPQFEELLKKDAFYSRICVIGVDECHLLLTWGRTFRKPYEQIRWMGFGAGLVLSHLADFRGRFRGSPVVI